MRKYAGCSCLFVGSIPWLCSTRETRTLFLDIVRISLSRDSLESSQNGEIGTETIQEWSLEVFTVLLQ